MFDMTRFCWLGLGDGWRLRLHPSPNTTKCSLSFRPKGGIYIQFFISCNESLRLAQNLIRLEKEVTIYTYFQLK